MAENTQNETPKKKMSLQEAVLKQLEAKKNKANGGGSINTNANSPKKMKSQQSKKTSNTRRKMGV